MMIVMHAMMTVEAGAIGSPVSTKHVAKGNQLFAFFWPLMPQDAGTAGTFLKALCISHPIAIETHLYTYLLRVELTKGLASQQNSLSISQQAFISLSHFPRLGRFIFNKMNLERDETTKQTNPLNQKKTL
jgi:hypothetical protein